MSKLTVLQVIPRLQAGGAENGTLQVSAALVAAGHRALVATEGGRLEEQLRASGAEALYLPVASKNPWRILRNAAALADIVRAEHVDILHARSRAPAWSAFLAAKRTGIPFVTTYHSGYSEKGRLKNLYNSVMARCDKVIAVSNAMADLIRDRYNTPEHKIAIIHRGADPDIFDPDKVDVQKQVAMRAAWGVPEERQIVLLAGRLARRKAQDVLVEAMGYLQEEGIDTFHTILAGDDHQGKTDYVQALIARGETLGVGERLHRVGHVDDIATAYSLADMSLCISSSEGFPRVALESQAMGCPVIVSDIGPGREVARTPPDTPLDESTGLRVPHGDARALADAIKTLLAMTSDERKAIGRRGSELVRGRYTIAQLCEKTLAVYQEVVRSRDHD